MFKRKNQSTLARTLTRLAETPQFYPPSQPAWPGFSNPPHIFTKKTSRILFTFFEVYRYYIEFNILLIKKHKVMKAILKIFGIFLLAMIMFIGGCKKTDDEVTETVTLSEEEAIEIVNNSLQSKSAGMLKELEISITMVNALTNSSYKDGFIISDTVICDTRGIGIIAIRREIVPNSGSNWIPVYDFSFPLNYEGNDIKFEYFLHLTGWGELEFSLIPPYFEILSFRDTNEVNGYWETQFFKMQSNHIQSGEVSCDDPDYWVYSGNYEQEGMLTYEGQFGLQLTGSTSLIMESNEVKVDKDTKEIISGTIHWVFCITYNNGSQQCWEGEIELPMGG